MILAANGSRCVFGAGVAAVQKVYAEAAGLKLRRRVRDRMKILVAEPMAAAGLELLAGQPGWEVIVSNPRSTRSTWPMPTR